MKNKSFRYTFYFGLLIILILTGLLTSISINIYKSISKNFSIKKEDETIVEIPLTPEKEIIHDTIFFEKPTVKLVDTPKPKKSFTPNIPVKTTDTVLNDSVN